MSSSYTLAEIAERVGGVVRGTDATARGDTSERVSGVADLLEAGPTDIAWVGRPEYAKRIAETRAGAVLVPADFGPTPVPAVECKQLDRSIALLLALFAPPSPALPIGIHPSAVIDATAKLGDGVAIGPFVQIQADTRIGDGTVLHAGVFVGRGTTLGRECVLWPNVVIRDGCVVGDRVVLHPNAVIGADGFGFYFDQGRHHKVPHIGGVILEDDVEVGACSCIDRAKFGFTVIGRGTKIDNLCQIGHNARVGEHCVLAGQSGYGGSVRIGDYCAFGGRAGIVDNVTLGRGARVSVASIVYNDVPPGVTVSGYPAHEHQRFLREQALVRRLPELAKELRDLRARVKHLEAAADHPPRSGD